MNPTLKATMLIMEIVLTTPTQVNTWPPENRPDIVQIPPTDKEGERSGKYTEWVNLAEEMERDEEAFAAYIERCMKSGKDLNDEYIQNRVGIMLEKGTLDANRIFAEMDEEMFLADTK